MIRQQAADEAKTVLAVETQFAKSSRTPIQLRDVVANYHRMTLAQVDSLTPHFEWASFYSGVGAPTVERIDVGQPEFFTSFDKMLTSVPLADWKTLLRWRLVHAAASSLSTPFVNENFDVQQALHRRDGDPAAVEALRRRDRRRARRAARPGVRRRATSRPRPRRARSKIVDNLVRELRDRIDSSTG